KSCKEIVEAPREGGPQAHPDEHGRIGDNLHRPGATYFTPQLGHAFRPLDAYYPLHHLPSGYAIPSSILPGAHARFRSNPLRTVSDGSNWQITSASSCQCAT